MRNRNEREVSRGLGVGGRNQRCSKKRWSLCHWESIVEGRGGHWLISLKSRNRYVT